MRTRLNFGNIWKLWWIPLVIGVISCGLGVWMLCAPFESMRVLPYIFAGCLCAAGLLQLVFSAFMARYNDHWGWSLVLGILDIVAGVWMLCLPAEAMETAFILIMGVWILCVAIDSIAESAVMASYSAGWMVWMLLLLCATIVCAIIFLSNPIAGGVMVWMWVSISLICYGMYRISMSAAIRNSRRY